MKKEWALFLAIVFCSGLIAFNVQAQSKNAMVFKIGSAATPKEPLAIATQKFADLVNERLAGQLKIEYYPAEQLGNETTMFENMQVDLQQGLANALDSYGNYCKDLNIMGMAFAFASQDHLFKYLSSDLGKSALNKLEKQGYHILTYNCRRNPRCIFAKKPITKPEDLKGIKFRIPNIPIWEKNFRTLGAIPVYVAWSEAPYALMQGVVDAGECSRELLYPMGFYKACPYVTLVDYAYPLDCIVLSTKSWNRLNPEQQKVVQQCADEASELYNSIVKTKWDEDKGKMLKEGVHFVDFDKDAFIKKMAPLAAELEKDKFWDTPGLYDKIQALR